MTEMLALLRRFLGRILAVTILIAAGWAIWQVNRVGYREPRTDDATVRANVIGIAPEVGGRVTGLHVRDNQEVAAGTLLFEIERAPFEAELALAEAELELARSEAAGLEQSVAAAYAEIDRLRAELATADDVVNRYRPLVQRGAVAQLALDDAVGRQRALRAAVAKATSEHERATKILALVGGVDARVRAAEARRDKARINLNFTRVYAPFTARISNLNVSVGAYVRPGEALFALIDIGRWWVVANFQESYLDAIRPGAPVDVRLVSYPDTKFSGHIQEIGFGIALGPPASAGPPIVAAVSNWVRVANRIPVRIDLDAAPPDRPYRMGMTATVTVNRSAAGW